MIHRRIRAGSRSRTRTRLCALLILAAIVSGCNDTEATSTPTAAPVVEPVAPPTASPAPTETTTTEAPATPTAEATPIAPAPLVTSGRVDVGGYQLALHCEGDGTPAVILEAGLGASSEQTWSQVQSRVAEFTRVCRYDRAGLGQSDPGPSPRTSERMVEELHTLLGNARIGGPYVLVGHSFGGLNARLYAARHPEEVVGVVLVDALHEDQLERVLALLPPEEPDESAALKALRQTLVTPSRNAEGVDILASAQQVRAAGSLGDRPLVVLTAGVPPQWPALVPPGAAATVEQDWLELQAELVSLSSQGRQVVAAQSGHTIPQEEPVLVAEAIREVVGLARNQ